MTFVDVPVDTVTFYLQPTLSTACVGDPGSTGNYTPQDFGQVTGQLIWPSSNEGQRGAWNNVPAPGPGERQAAYVLDASGAQYALFSLPSPSTATTPASSGAQGYAYSLTLVPGNQTLYALAGLEQDTDGGQAIRFEPFVMGVVRGVSVQPNVTLAGVDIGMATLLDRALTIVPQPPQTTPAGPDRLVSTLSVDLGAGAFALLPQGSTTQLLPVSGGVSFVGIPALDGALAGARYDLAVAAFTGASNSTPLSIVSGVETTDANDRLTIGGFVGVPALLQPSATVWSGTHVQVQATGAIDLAVVSVSSGDALIVWQIVAPGTDLSFDLPDLSQLKGVDTLVHGVLSTSFSVARMNGFDYGTLRFGQLGPSAWNAYASNVALGSY
jgi:hypothetical protein